LLVVGDLQQILPVADGKIGIIRASLFSSPLWPHFVRLKLTKNMRLENPNLTDDQRQKQIDYAHLTEGIGK
jgi:hypothetical protein